MPQHFSLLQCLRTRSQRGYGSPPTHLYTARQQILLKRTGHRAIVTAEPAHRPMQRVGVADSLPWWRADTPVTVSNTLCIRPTRLTHRTGALPSGQETLPFEKRNLPSLRLQNHHLTMNHRTEPHAADKTPLNRITKMITKAASTHANWWGYYRQKD